MKPYLRGTKYETASQPQVSKGGEDDLHHYARLPSRGRHNKASIDDVKLDAQVNLLYVCEHHSDLTDSI